MKIESLAVALPSRVVTNDDVVDEIATHSKNFSGDLPRTLRQIRLALKASGAKERRWLGPGETSLELTVRACRTAMDALTDDQQIDLVICASVYGELIEPATANLIAHETGLDRAECFDVKEACDGWMKAARIASLFIESGQYRRIMVVNDEFVMRPGFGVFPELFDLASPDQLEHRFPGYTLGEAATATIFGPDSDSPWRFTNRTRNDLYDLCTIAPRYETYRLVSPRVAKDGLGIFTSYGTDLRHHGLPTVVELFKQSGIKTEEVDHLFTHSSSKADWAEAARRIGLSDKIRDIYFTCGNVVSAAIPAAMALAFEDGTLQRRQRVAVWVASAGMSFSTAYFVF